MKISNARYTNPEKTLIDVLWDHPVYGEIPYTAKEGDGVFEEATKGDVGEWIAPEPVPKLTFVDSDDNEVKYDVSDIDFLRVSQAKQAFELGATKVKVKFTTGDEGVFTADKLDELFKEAYQIKAAEYVVE